MTSSFALTKNYCTFPLPSQPARYPKPSLFRHVYSYPSIFHPDVSVSAPDPSLIYLLRYIQPRWFVYVAIRLFRSHKYLTPFWKSHLHVGTKCVWYHYRHTPMFNRPSAAVPSTRRIPWDTVFHNIYILSLFSANSSDSACYANHEIA